MLQAFHKFYPKPKTIPERKSLLHQIWDNLPQTTINNSITDFHNRLNACTSVGGRHFEHAILTLYRNILTELYCFGRNLINYMF